MVAKNKPEHQDTPSEVEHSAPDDFRASLSRDLPTSIIFRDEGDFIIGEFVSVQIADNGSEYGPAPVAVILCHSGHANGDDLDSDREYSVWFFHATLLSQAKNLKPHKGERVGITYRGERVAKDAKPRSDGSMPTYREYRMRVDRSAQSFDWEAVPEKAR